MKKTTTLTLTFTFTRVLTRRGTHWFCILTSGGHKCSGYLPHPPICGVPVSVTGQWQQRNRDQIFCFTAAQYSFPEIEHVTAFLKGVRPPTVSVSEAKIYETTKRLGAATTLKEFSLTPLQPALYFSLSLPDARDWYFAVKDFTTIHQVWGELLAANIPEEQAAMVATDLGVDSVSSWLREQTTRSQIHPISIPQLILEASGLSGSLYFTRAQLQDVNPELFGKVWHQRRRALRAGHIMRRGVYWGLSSSWLQETAISTWLSTIQAQGVPLSSYLQDSTALPQTITQAKVGLIVGAPGAGKTHAILTLLQSLRHPATTEVVLLAPTGKAARRIQEAVGDIKPYKLHISTIHRYFQEGRTKPHICVIDETSMLESHLLYQVSQTCTPHCLFFLGDQHQLPSIGPGQVLQDLYTSGVIPTWELSSNYRHTEGLQSLLAHLRYGKPLPDAASHLIEFLDITSSTDLAEWIIAQPDPASIQVISPCYNHALGIHNLNRSLQRCFQPSPLPTKPPFHVGDKVTINTNSYELGVTNGQQGILIGQSNTTLSVDMGDEVIELPTEFSSQMSLGYAISVHKSQGSEYDTVVVCLRPGMPLKLLHQQLIYTAVTRPRKRLIIVGSLPFLNTCMTTPPTPRKTYLHHLLQQS